MAAGFHFESAPPIEREVCDEKSIYRLTDGGMDLDMSNLPAKGWLPELAPLFRDKKERKATVCLRVKVVEKATTGATTIKVAKCPFLDFIKAGMSLSDGTNVITVKSVDTSNEDYDVITATAATKADLKVGKVLPEAKGASDPKARNVANFASFGWRDLSKENTVALVGSAYSIIEDNLYIPFTEEDKVALTERFMFI